MKSYLGLVAEYAKVHKRKHRLTVICIAISVMLVTTIFGMADMSIRAQINAYTQMEGNYHAIINGISDDIARQIGSRREVAVSDWVGVAKDTVYQGKKLMMLGSGQAIAQQMNLVAEEGRYPETEGEALLDQKALQQFGIKIGDTIEVPFEDGTVRAFLITGTFGSFSGLKAEDAHGLYLTLDGVRSLSSKEYQESYYVQFKKGGSIRETLSSIKADYGLSDKQVSENTRLLALMGQSSDSTILQIYLTAGILFVLVTMAGVFMIAGSFNMSIVERTQFFGLLRCLGASKRQVRRYIRLEGVRYSLKGIPIGLLAGCVTMWIAVFVLNTLNLKSVLPEMPLFQLSFKGILAGFLIGFLVTMLASRAPAKRAASVSPQAAVTGNGNQASGAKSSRGVNTKLPIEIAMGIHHAFEVKKNLLLTAGSFALSMILLLSFSVFVVFMQHAVNPLKPYAADISLTAEQGAVMERSLLEKLRALPKISQVYGRMFCYDIPLSVNGQEGKATLVSYDKPQFAWAEEMLIAGSMQEVQNQTGVLVCYDKSQASPVEIGDTVVLMLDGKPFKLPVAGILSDMPFQAENAAWTLICSEEVFTKLTGTQNYTIIDIQVEEDISNQIRNAIPPELKLLDMQDRNQESRTAYYTMAVFVYGFVFVIALVAFINIINTVNASISSRIGHYGVMRAVGMSGKQLKKVVSAEAVTYAAAGCVAGAILGLCLHRYFFEQLVSGNWGTAWEPPLLALAVMVAAAIITTCVSVIYPTKRVQRMDIVSAVNAQS